MKASAILAFLDSRRAEETARPADAEAVTRYRHAAAVLASIKAPHELRPVGGGGEENEGVRLLGQELVQATARKFDGGVILRPDVRRAAIRELADPAARRAALDANPGERAGSIQSLLEAYLLGTPPPLDEMPLEQLQEVLQLSVWLEDSVENMPPAETVRHRIAYKSLIAPFEELAGDAVFRGRQSELDRLRKYVGVLPPASLLSRLHSQATQWLRPDKLPAVSVSGPGGVGKSALIARFLLEHSRLPEAARLPFSYLDFDRATLDIARPATLVAEMLHQLELQFPGQFGYLLDFLMKRVEEHDRRDQPDSKDGNLSLERSVFLDMIGILEGHLGPRPYIVVLDTFEEVQYRGENRAFPVWEMLAYMQEAKPFLRVVISGRAPVQTLTLAGRLPESLALGDLDTDAAVAFLMANGVGDETTAAAVVRQVGGVPLSLKLAASLLRREDAAPGGIKNLTGRSRYWFSPADEEIQGHLYERLLGRIHNPRVERLAHPGLVLRRITPEVILYVLNEPCRLEVQTLEEARQLQDELRKETSLVAADTLDGSLVHRPDVRRTMLKLLVQKQPALVERIRRAAVGWYSTQTDWRARAEEVYQRLQLGETLTRAEIVHPEVRSSIQASISELPEPVQLALLQLGFQVSSDVLQKASQTEYEAHIAAQVEELLPYGPLSVSRALSVLETEMPVEHSSPLFRSRARVVAQRDLFIEAGEWIEKGMRWAALAGDSLKIMELAQEIAWLRRDFSKPDRDQALGLLGEYAQRFDAPAAVFQFRAQTLRQEEPTPSRNAELCESFLRLTPADLWGVFPVLGEPNVQKALADSPVALEALGGGILSEEGNFIRAEFSNSVVDAALRELLEAISFEPGQVLRQVQNLCRVWPYKILHVHPPYGSRGVDPSEAALF